MALCSQVEAWLEFWHVWLVVNFILACVFTVWFLAGGLRDLRRLFAHLDRAVRDHQDDGSVGSQAAAASGSTARAAVGAGAQDSERKGLLQ